MSQANKKKWEVHLVRSFLERIRRQATSIGPGAEPPDVVVHCGTKRIEVELTEYHADESRKGGSKRRKRLGFLYQIEATLCDAQGRYPSLKSVAISVHSAENEAEEASRLAQIDEKRDLPRFVGQLFAFVESRIPLLDHELKKRMEFRDFNSQDNDVLKRYVDLVTLSKIDCEFPLQIFCREKQGSFTTPATADILATTVKKKASKIANAIRDVSPACHETWLLVIEGDAYDPVRVRDSTDDLNLSTELRNVLLDSAFPYDSVFLYDYWLGQVIRWRRGKSWRKIRRSQMDAPDEVE